jgi:predicted Zn-dependent protease
MRFLNTLTGTRSPRWTELRYRPQLEGLENRVVPYTTSGNLWPNPQLVTISFMPDGTNLGGATSNLFSTFNARWATSTWQNQILKAAQVWAQQTNINFAVIADSGADSGSGNYQQGDPTMGDVRIGGYNFGTSTLAMAYQPPPVNNYSIAGDIAFNTSVAFNIGSTYDLFTVAVHEFGHALGLLHSTATASVMYATYGSTKYGLNSDDINGIRNIYSNNNPRSTDVYGGANNSFCAAANINSLINLSNDTALLSNMDITTAGQKAYYVATAPAGTGCTTTISVQSSGLSLLAPKVTVYACDQVTVLGSANGAGHYGTTLTVSLTNQVSAGQVLYIKVGGADNTAFGTGIYALSMSFGLLPPPSATPPNTQVPNGDPISGGGGIAMTDPSQRTDSVSLADWGPLFHGGGCGCPACRAAAAAALTQVEMIVNAWETITSDSATAKGLARVNGVLDTTTVSIVPERGAATPSTTTLTAQAVDSYLSDEESKSSSEFPADISGGLQDCGLF